MNLSTQLSACALVCLLAACGERSLGTPPLGDDGPMGGDSTPSTCGNGQVDGAEACDDGAASNTGGYGGCNPNCTFAPFCGDGARDLGVEDCDDGTAANNGGYGGCNADCTRASYCGDGVRDMGFEACDLGLSGNDGSRDGCNADCTLGPFCGDGTEDAGDEECDLGAASNLGGRDGCNGDCTRGPYCGDGNEDVGDEECDLGTALNDGSRDGCNANCTLGPYCGDGFEDVGDEACDLGTLLNNGARDGCNANCTLAPYCGDGVEDMGDEECDLGTTLNVGGRDGCNANCTLGPYCGDGNPDVGFEDCDDGDGNTGDGCTPTCVGEVTSALTGLALTHTANERPIVVDWDVGAYTGGAQCQVRVDAEIFATVACTTEQVSMNLPWDDGQPRWNESLDLTIDPIEKQGDPSVTSAITFDCVKSLPSVTPEPLVDRDCDTNWDNEGVFYDYGDPIAVEWFGDTSISRAVTLTAASSSECLDACKLAGTYEEDYPFTIVAARNCYWDGTMNDCWMGGTSYLTSMPDPDSFVWERTAPEMRYY